MPIWIRDAFISIVLNASPLHLRDNNGFIVKMSHEIFSIIKLFILNYFAGLPIINIEKRVALSKDGHFIHQGKS